MLFYVLLRVVMAFAAYVGLALLLTLVDTTDPDSILSTTPSQLPALSPPLVTKTADILSGRFGQSIFAKEPVSRLIGQRIGTTLSFAGLAALVAAMLAVPLGLLAGRQPGSVGDRLLLRLALPLESVPAFLTGIVLIVILAISLSALPVGGVGSAAHFVMPVLTLAIAIVPSLLRRMRNGMSELRASEGGATPGRVIGLSGAALLAGLVSALCLAPIPETVFALPGLGRLLIDAVARRDGPLTIGAAMTLSTMCIALALMSDMLRAAVGPEANRHGLSHELSHLGEWPGTPRLLSFGAIIGCFIALSFFGLSFLGGDAAAIDFVRQHSSPSWTHWLGTDSLGRDVFAMTTQGLRNTLLVSLAVAVAATIIGAALGLLGGLARPLGLVLRTMIEARLSLPVLILVFAVLTITGASAVTVAVVLGLTLWEGAAAATLAARQQKSMLPPLPGHPQLPRPTVSANPFGAILAAFFHTAAIAALLFESVNFLGFGVAPPSPSPGGIIGNGRLFLATNALPAIISGLMLAALILGLLLIADGLRPIGRKSRGA